MSNLVFFIEKIYNGIFTIFSLTKYSFRMYTFADSEIVQTLLQFNQKHGVSLSFISMVVSIQDHRIIKSS